MDSRSNALVEGPILDPIVQTIDYFFDSNSWVMKDAPMEDRSRIVAGFEEGTLTNSDMNMCIQLLEESIPNGQFRVHVAIVKASDILVAQNTISCEMDVLHAMGEFPDVVRRNEWSRVHNGASSAMVNPEDLQPYSPDTVMANHFGLYLFLAYGWWNS